MTTRASFVRYTSAIAIPLLASLTLVTGCPFHAETFHRLCTTPSDCSDGNPCTDDKCIDGVCENPETAKETACPSPTNGVCDGAGKCVQCLSNVDCSAHHVTTPICDTKTHECVSCSDGEKNGNETDVDCGGPDCGACVGHTCDAKHGCGNGGFCAMPENICCTTACDKKCEACSMAKTGMPDGTCAPIPYGMDPDSECTTSGKCSDVPNKCRCEDGKQNGDETDIDCGGPTCPTRCGGGKSCDADKDCAADVSTCTAKHTCCTNTCDGSCVFCDTTGECMLAVGQIDPSCAGGLVCGPIGAPCVQVAGTPCTANAKCLSKSCLLPPGPGTCAPSALGMPCNTDGDCATGTCKNFVCSS